MIAGVLPEHLHGPGSALSALPQGRQGSVQIKPLSKGVAFPCPPRTCELGEQPKEAVLMPELTWQVQLCRPSTPSSKLPSPSAFSPGPRLLVPPLPFCPALLGSSPPALLFLHVLDVTSSRFCAGGCNL